MKELIEKLEREISDMREEANYQRTVFPPRTVTRTFNVLDKDGIFPDQVVTRTVTVTLPGSGNPAVAAELEKRADSLQRLVDQFRYAVAI